MRKIIFLDIDGVIAVPPTWKLSIAKQELLGKILEKTDAEIVLSSSWRCLTLEDTKDRMTEAGFLYTDKLVGVTIRAYHYIEGGVHLSIPRGVEIKQWLDTNIHSDNGRNYDRKEPKVDFNYVILDDDSDMLLEQEKNFIKTDSEQGIQEHDVYKAIGILNQ